MSQPRVAHFLLTPQLAGSPPNRAALDAYRDLGFHVDLFAPGGGPDTRTLGPDVSGFPVDYGYRWLARHALSPRWQRYAALSGTTEDPQGVAGVIARLHRRPLITFADEIFSGSYAGNRSERWKHLCRSNMARARLTIVNEQERISLQRAYAGLPPQAEVIVYPGCFHEPPAPDDRHSLRASRGLPQDALVMAYSGVFHDCNGGLWLMQALEECPELWVWGQVLHEDPLVHGLMRQARGSERLVLEASRMGWQEAWASMGAVDIGQVIYLKDAPQFHHMGIASNRLCMFLTMGVPVIASRQPSFSFLEEYDCGVLIDGPDEMAAAVRRIGSRLELMRANALHCSREYIRAPQRWRELRDALAAVVGQRDGQR